MTRLFKDIVYALSDMIADLAERINDWAAEPGEGSPAPLRTCSTCLRAIGGR